MCDKHGEKQDWWFHEMRLHSYCSAPTCRLELRCQHTHKRHLLPLFVCVILTVLCQCCVPMQCLPCVVTAKQEQHIALGKIRAIVVRLRLPSCGSCNQYLFVVAAVPMMF